MIHSSNLSQALDMKFIWFLFLPKFHFILFYFHSISRGDWEIFHWVFSHFIRFFFFHTFLFFSFFFSPRFELFCYLISIFPSSITDFFILQWSVIIGDFQFWTARSTHENSPQITSTVATAAVCFDYSQYFISHFFLLFISIFHRFQLTKNARESRDYSCYTVTESYYCERSWNSFTFSYFLSTYLFTII